MTELEKIGFQQFAGQWGERAQLAWDTIDRKPTRGIPAGGILNVMGWSALEQLSGHAPGSYPKDPNTVYRDFEYAAGMCMIDQWIPDNPLCMGDQGYEGATHGATTGAEEVVVDGIVIDSPEAVCEHLERFIFPQTIRSTADLDIDVDGRVRKLIEQEVELQRYFGMDMLKDPYGGFQSQPGFAYGLYGYANYFMTFALYPEVLEKQFRLQADFAEKYNAIAARAIVEGGLPKLVRFDHDIADSRGTLARPEVIDAIWLPHFTRCIQPLLKAGVKIIWHCDGNLMEMVPRLLAAGLSGFQGFQYEDGMDYERICRMKTKNGDGLIIIGGVSVTRTLPFGTPADVKREVDWLVANGPKTGLFLAASSSVAPGTPVENIRTMIEGFNYYREHGRG